MKIHHANFDYEYQLFGLKNTAATTISQEFECLYFFTESNPGQLFTHKNYSNEFLDYVEKVSGLSPHLTTVGKAEYWWGSLENLEVEKKLNSKLTSTQFAIENNLSHPQTQIILENESLIKSDELMVLKQPNLMSGRGFFRYDNNNFKKAVEWSANKFPLIQEPWLVKRDDIGSYYFTETGEIVNYLNFSNLQGNYKGTRIWQNPVHTFDELTALGINLDLFFENMVKIKDHYLKLGATQGFSIDSFTYLSNHEKKIQSYYLSEVNYRKTMGWATHQLRKFLADYAVGELLIHKAKNRYPLSVLLNLVNQEQVILLSPPENQFLLFFLKAQDKNQLRSLEESINKL